MSVRSPLLRVAYAASSLLEIEPAPHPLYTTLGVHDTLFTRVKRVALVAYFNLQLGLRGPSNVGRAA